MLPPIGEVKNNRIANVWRGGIDDKFDPHIEKIIMRALEDQEAVLTLLRIPTKRLPDQAFLTALSPLLHMFAIIRCAYEKRNFDQLIQFPTAIAHHSREYALKLKALEQVAKEAS